MEVPQIATTASVGTNFGKERQTTDRIREEALERIQGVSQLLEQIGSMGILATLVGSVLLFTIPQHLAGIPDLIRENPIMFTLIAGGVSSAVAFIGNRHRDNEIECIKSEARSKIWARWNQYPDANVAGNRKPSIDELTRGL
jgi:hypothetical protein